MWELIRANRRRSFLLFLILGACLIALGYAIGFMYAKGNGGVAGIFFALMIWFFLWLISYFNGDSILLSLSKAKEVNHDVHPQLFNIVEEMKIASSLPAMPKVYIIPDPAPNAFATGIKQEKSAVAVTAGILSMLNRDELQGVIAHEMSHIKNRDVQFMSLAGVALGSIVLISEIFLRSLWYSGSGRRFSSGRSSRGGGQAQVVVMIIAIVLAILAPIIAQLLYFAISRKREYLADASAVRLTRYPEGLASALEKISNTNLDLASASKATAPLYIVNPLKPKGKKLSDLTSTHPPISERIRILRNIAQGVGFSEYQKAYSSVTRKKSAIIPPSGLKEKENIPLRNASEELKIKEKKKQIRDAGDIMRMINNFVFLTCMCGLKLKVPPDFKNKTVTCPRCKRELKIQTVETN